MKQNNKLKLDTDIQQLKTRICITAVLLELRVVRFGMLYCSARIYFL